MKIIEFIEELQKKADHLKASYQGAFEREVRPGCVMMPSRFAWEVRIAAGHRSLEKAISQLKTTAAEADDMKEWR